MPMPMSNAFGLIPSMSGLGDTLMSQVRDETEAERKKRLQAQKFAGSNPGMSMSPAGQALFGDFGGGLR
jgi:hypothetical protein